MTPRTIRRQPQGRLAEELTELIANSGASQGEIAVSAGMDPGYFNRLRTGQRRSPSRGKILEISRALGASNEPAIADRLLRSADQEPLTQEELRTLVADGAEAERQGWLDPVHTVAPIEARPPRQEYPGGYSHASLPTSLHYLVFPLQTKWHFQGRTYEILSSTTPLFLTVTHTEDLQGSSESTLSQNRSMR
jgi:transcriptional regulator with XRE-family HTH domain